MISTTGKLAIVIGLLSGVAAISITSSAELSSHYMGGPAELVTAPNGAIVNRVALEEFPKTAWTNGPEIQRN